MRPVAVLAAALVAVPLLVEIVSAAESGNAAAPVPPARPIEALQTAGAERGMLLGVARAGSQYVAVGGNGVIVRSADGKTWQQVVSPVDTALNAVAFADDQHGWAVGHDAVILGTTDGGATWKIQNFEPELYTPIFAILPISADTAIAVGAFGTVKATAEGGAHWGNVDAPSISEEKLHLNAIARLNNGKLALAGEHGMIGVSANGLQWTKIPNPYEGSFFGILPWGPNGAIAYGMRGNVYSTADISSGTWEKIDTGSTASFFGGELLPDGRIVLTGAEGSVMVISADGKASTFSGAQRGANEGSLTGSLSAGDALIVVGESGPKVLPKI